MKRIKRDFGILSDAFTGEDFKAKSANHYEENDGVPVAPPVEIARPTVRQRVENLLNRGVDPLAHYVGYEGVDMDVPEDEDAPLTPSEENYIELMASQIAEAAPLPDEGLPRPPTPPSEANPSPQPPQPPSEPVSSPAPSPAKSTVPT